MQLTYNLLFTFGFFNLLYNSTVGTVHCYHLRLNINFNLKFINMQLNDNKCNSVREGKWANRNTNIDTRESSSCVMVINLWSKRLLLYLQCHSEQYDSEWPWTLRLMQRKREHFGANQVVSLSKLVNQYILKCWHSFWMTRSM